MLKGVSVARRTQGESSLEGDVTEPRLAGLGPEREAVLASELGTQMSVDAA